MADNRDKCILTSLYTPHRTSYPGKLSHTHLFRVPLDPPRRSYYKQTQDLYSVRLSPLLPSPTVYLSPHSPLTFSVFHFFSQLCSSTTTQSAYLLFSLSSRKQSEQNWAHPSVRFSAFFSVGGTKVRCTLAIPLLFPSSLLPILQLFPHKAW